MILGLLRKGKQHLRFSGFVIMLVAMFLLLHGPCYAADSDIFWGREMLGRPTDQSICVNVVPRLSLDFYIEYGELPGNYKWSVGKTKALLPLYEPLINTIPERPIVVQLTGLLPNKAYYYRIRYREANKGEFQSGEEREFRTKRNIEDEFTFIITADSHIGARIKNTSPLKAKVFSRTFENIASEHPDFYVILGDEAMTQKVKTKQKAFDRYKIMRYFYDKVCHSIPLFYVLGNHDGEGSWHDRNVALWSREARLIYTLNPDNHTYPQGGHKFGNFYSFTWGNALFVILDPFLDTGRFDPKYSWFLLRFFGGSWTLGESQFEWLQKVLDSSEEKHKFIFTHHILASWGKNGYGRGGAKYAYDNNQGKLQHLMEKYGVKILFYGHDHIFADGIAGGVHYTVCGQPSSHKIPSWSQPDNPEFSHFKEAYPYPYFLEKGYVKVEVGNDLVKVSYIKTSLDKTNRKVLYSYTCDALNPNP